MWRTRYILWRTRHILWGTCCGECIVGDRLYLVDEVLWRIRYILWATPWTMSPTIYTYTPTIHTFAPTIPTHNIYEHIVGNVLWVTGYILWTRYCGGSGIYCGQHSGQCNPQYIRIHNVYARYPQYIRVFSTTYTYVTHNIYVCAPTTYT